jgi:hypothetical protein
LDLFCESVDKALDSDLPLLLVGDYNCDMLSNSSNYFKKILNRLNLENVVFEATHFTPPFKLNGRSLSPVGDHIQVIRQ